MYYFKVGDIVSRKSYGNDIHFLIKVSFIQKTKNRYMF
jgi:hypothetical protein